MAKRKRSRASRGSEGGFVPLGTAQTKKEAVHSAAFDMIFSMIADRIRAGEDPEEAAKAVLELAKEFAEADEIIFDDEKNVSIEVAEEKKKDAD